MPRRKLVRVSTKKVAAALLSRIPTASDKARMIRGLTAAGMQFWKRQAQSQLRSSSRDYVAGLQTDIGPEKGSITLVGVLPNLIEQGFKGGDMRGWMFGGGRAKRSKAGHRYLTVPFRHGTPGTSGRNVGAPMPASIHKAAKQLTPTLSRPKLTAAHRWERTVQWGERLHPGLPFVKKAAQKILSEKAKPWHAGSIYRGMIRQEKVFEQATQTTGYHTFRVISENVIRGKRDPEGGALEHWYHPGIKARRFARDTTRHVRQIASGIIGVALREHGAKRSA